MVGMAVTCVPAIIGHEFPRSRACVVVKYRHTMSESIEKNRVFAYEAQTAEGAPMRGTLEAVDADAARWQLQSLGLRVLSLSVDGGGADAKPKPLRGDDFVAFNQQLASLTQAGLPLEQGLRLIARDMRSGRLAASVNAVAADLEKGTPLDEAFAAHTDKFPALYASLLAAGVRTGNLTGALLNLGRHLELMQRLREMVWRAAAYPVMVFVSMLGLLTVLGFVVVPQFRAVFEQMVGGSDAYSSTGTPIELPWITRMVFAAAEMMPAVLIGAAVLIAAITAWVVLASRTGRGWTLIDRIVLPMPVIGPFVRANLVARWCDAMSMCVEAGLDLPASIALSAELIGAPALADDCRGLTVAHDVGEPLESTHGLRVLPYSVAAAMDLGLRRADLEAVMLTMREMYRQQAEHRLAVVQAVMRPIMVVAAAAPIAIVIIALFYPLRVLVSFMS
ncbi:MAG: hypothetical protein GC159_04735 [Phycisphaera sp.]|nr:hypothetical protein [Phycisphaera sp.]